MQRWSIETTLSALVFLFLFRLFFFFLDLRLPVKTEDNKKSRRISSSSTCGATQKGSILQLFLHHAVVLLLSPPYNIKSWL